MRFLSLFAGIGGFDLGLERAGFECAGQVEINPFCQKVLAKHWPNVKRISDIREVKGNEFGKVDIICGGYPCQPFSTAGKRQGSSDDRYLWPEMLRLIGTIKPTWVIGENVIGHITKGLFNVKSDLENKGYEVKIFCIPAYSVGAPHKRERVWIIANNNSRRRNTQPLSSSIAQEGECATNVDRTDATEREKNPWLAEPTMERVVYGVSRKLDKIRLTMIGNAVVPQVVEVIGRAILRAHVLCAERLPDIKEARLTAYNTAMPGGVPPQICEAQTSA
jgi:DNA (cytosine-5)-methyltransferase 1